MTQTSTVLQIPDALRPADGRFGSGPSRLRPQQLEHLASAGAEVMGTSHRQAPVRLAGRRDARRPARAVRLPGRLRGRRSATAARRRSGTRHLLPGPRAGAAPDLRGVRLEVRRLHADGAVPGRPDRDRGPAPGTRPSPKADRRADVLAWAHNETSTGVMVPVHRPAGADAIARADRRDLRRRRPAGRRRARPTPTTSPRRRASPPTAACGSRCSARPRSSGSQRSRRARRRPLDPGVPVAQDRGRELGQGPDLQHARDRDPVPARRAARLDARPGRPRRDGRAHHAPRPATSTAGRAASARHAVRRRSGQALARGRHDRLRRPGRRRRRSPRPCAPTGSSTSSPTASSAATSCGSRCSRRPTRGRAGPDRVHRLRPGEPMTRVLVAENIGQSGIDLLKEHFDVDLGTGWDREQLAERDRRL